MLRKFLLLICFYICCHSYVSAQQVFVVKIPGYTGYAIPSQKGIEFDDLVGCTEWTNENITLQYNVRIEAKGDLGIRLMLSNDGNEPAFLSVKFGDRTRELKVPPTGGKAKFQMVDAGVFTADYPGFYSVWIKPISKSGLFYPGIMNVQMYAPFADKISFPSVAERNASTVNLTYISGQNEKINGMCVNTTVPNNYDYQGTRISAIANEVFKVGLANEESGKYLYVTWKNVKGYVKPTFQYSQFKNYSIDSSMEKMSRFIVPYNWAPDQVISLSLVHKVDSCTLAESWEARIYNEKKKKWNTIAVLSGGNTSGLVKDWYSAVANSDPNTGNVEHKEIFSNPVAWLSNGKKKKITQARFGHDMKGKVERKDYGAGVETDTFWLSTGGFSYSQATFGKIYETKSKVNSVIDERFSASF